MKDEKRTFRLISILVLLLSFILISGFSWYAVNKQYTPNNQDAIKNIPVRQALPKPETEPPKPTTDSSTIAKADSAQSTKGVTTDTNHIVVVKVRHPKKKTEIKDAPQPVVTDNTKKTITTPHAEEKYAKWRIVVKKDMLCVYPGDKWQNIFVVYPNTTSNKENKHILKPDFPGVIYLDAVIGNIDLNNAVNRVLIEKYTAGETFSKMPFFISLKFSPSFIIFGDYKDPLNQYIFQNNKISEYESFPPSDKMFSLNSN